MISIVNKGDGDFDGNQEVVYKVPEDTAVIFIQPKGGTAALLPSSGSSTMWSIDQDEKFPIRTRDIAAKSLVIKRSGAGVTVEILRYSGVLA